MHFTPESLVKGTLRSCFKTVGVVFGLFLGILIVGVLMMVFAGPAEYLPPKSQATIMPNAQGKRELLPGSDPAILRLDITGVIGVGDLTASAVNELLVDSQEDLLAHNRVKGVLLYINSPGGSATDSDTIYRMLVDYKQKYQLPIYAYVDGMCASGGMYIACAADKIYASPSSVVGSVGVLLGPTFNFTQAMDKVGIQALTLTEGKDKDFMNPFRPWKSDEAAPLRPVLSALYSRFVDIVAHSRHKIDKQKLIDVYGAHIFISSEAATLGYVDVADSDYNTALSGLTQQAGIADKQNYQVVKLSPPHSLLAEFAENKCGFLKGEITHRFSLSPEYSPELSGKFLYLYSPLLNVH